jgi:phospholipid transport system substrate-binding protein
MFIEGINMLLSERTEIGAMLDKRRGNIEKVMEDLQNTI